MCHFFILDTGIWSLLERPLRSRPLKDLLQFPPTTRIQTYRDFTYHATFTQRHAQKGKKRNRTKHNDCLSAEFTQKSSCRETQYFKT